MKDLVLHPKLGVNPHLTYCPRCGGDAREIILIGARDYINKCCECGLHLIGGGPCPDHPGRRTERVKMIGEHDKLPGSPCERCEKEVAEHAAIVAAGGVYFRCACGARGVIKATARIAGLAREKLGIAAPAACGIELDECPTCKKGDV